MTRRKKKSDRACNGERFEMYQKKAIKAKQAMQTARLEWDKFEAGQEVTITNREEKKDVSRTGKVISKNKHYMAVKCKNNVVTVTYSDIVSNAMHIYPLNLNTMGSNSNRNSKVV